MDLTLGDRTILVVDMEPNITFPLPPAVNIGIDFGFTSALNGDLAQATMWFDIAARAWDETYGQETSVPDEVWEWVIAKVRADYPTLPAQYPLFGEWFAVGGSPEAFVANRRKTCGCGDVHG